MHLSSKREAVSKIDVGHGGRLSRQTSLMRSLLIFTFLPNPSSHSHSSSKGLQVLRRALKSFYVYTSCNVCEFVSLYSNERRRRKDHGWKHHSLKATEKAIEGIHLRTVVPSLQFGHLRCNFIFLCVPKRAAGKCNFVSLCTCLGLKKTPLDLNTFRMESGGVGNSVVIGFDTT